MLAGVIFIVSGLICLFLGFSFAKNPLYTRQLSMNVFNRNMTKEHGAGFSWKWLWYELQGKPMDMRATIIITSGGIIVGKDWEEFQNKDSYNKITPRIYETEDGILSGKWAVPIRPAEDYLKILLLKTVPVAAIMTMGRVEARLSDKLAKMKTGDVLADKQAIGKYVGKIFGGNDERISSPHERRYGVVVGNPELIDLSYGEKSQAAQEKLFETKKFLESLDLIKDKFDNDQERSEAISIANGITKKQIIKFDGIEGSVKSLADAFVKILKK